MLKKKYKKGTMSLRSKALLDGVKKIPYKLGEIRQKVVKALRVEAYGLNSDTMSKGIYSILKGKAFNRFTMTGDIRLVSQY